MTDNTPTHWLAFRMSGFGGMVVPEPVASLSTDGRTAHVPCDGGFAVRHIPEDGTLFDNRTDCLNFCDRQNTDNPFWKRPT